MNHAVLFELDRYKKRLSYYQSLKTEAEARAAEATPSKKSAKPVASPVDKWIEIYAERVKKLEKQVGKLGLRVELGDTKSAKRLLS